MIDSTDAPCRCSPLGFVAVLAVLVGIVMAPVALSAQEPAIGGDGTIYIAGYDGAIRIVDEATMEVIGKIHATTGVPHQLQLSHDRRRLYSVTIDWEHIEVFDLEAGESIGLHTFSEGASRVRIWDFAVHPDDGYLMVLTSTDTKLVDRWQIEEPIIRQYDLASREFVRDFPWPGGDVRESANLMFSPAGDLLYFLANDLLVYDTETFEQVDKWEISAPLETGMGRLRFGFNQSLYEEPGFYTGLFNTTDPVNGRRMMGVASINLHEKSVDFYTLGPSTGVSFSLAPDRKKAYGLRQQIGDYQIWTFDLENRRVADRRSFPGRPRMQMTTSSNGKLLYIHTAGNTIDIYDAESLALVRTVTFEADMPYQSFVLSPAGSAGTR